MSIVRTASLSLALALLSTLPAFGAPAGFPGMDFPLDTLLDGDSNATYDPKADTLTTTDGQARLVLPAFAASPEHDLRYLEVALLPAVDVTVHATWFEGGIRLESERIAVSANTPDTVVLDLSTMGDTDGLVRLRINGDAAGTVISRVTLIEQSKPNLILIMVDDLREIELDLGFGRSLPQESVLESELVDGGTTFRNFFNTTPLCCPSRASYLTGRYSHNHGVLVNNYDTSDGNGGWRRFWELGHETASIGTWLQTAGYHTTLIGKFLNQYPNIPGFFVPENYVPLGWDEFYGSFTNEDFVPSLEPNPDEFSYYSFRINQNGTIVEYGVEAPAYLTDVERDLAVDTVRRAALREEPFFLYLTPYAPHGPTEPADRHQGAHDDLEVDPPPSFNEADLSDKPQHIQDGAEGFANYFGGGTRRKLDMTLALDELIDALFLALEDEGLLDRTYIFFTSDNGLLAGEHGIGGKSAPYEESVRTPLLVYGPGVTAGIERPELLANIDLAPTLLELAGAVPAPEIDGESFVELLTGARTELDWRDVVQIELGLTIDSPNQPHEIPPYQGVRGNRYVYIEYATGDRELYDLENDPFQLESLHDSAPLEILEPFQAALTDLTACAGEGCRQATYRGWPRATLTANCVLRECTFDSIGSVDTDGTIQSYLWDFGDGQGSTDPQVTHTYASDGDYAVTLTVFDNHGQPAVAFSTVVAKDPLFSDDFESGDTTAWSVEVTSGALSRPDSPGL